MSDDASKEGGETAKSESAEGSPAPGGPGFGDMTKAWMSAGSEIAEHEAALAAERRRMWIAGGAIAAVVAGTIAYLYVA